MEILGWTFCIACAALVIILTARWIARDYKKSKFMPMPTPTVAIKLDDAETLLNAKMAEVQELHEQSLKGMKFDKNFVPPPATPLDAKAEELRRMTEKRKP